MIVYNTLLDNQRPYLVKEREIENQIHSINCPEDLFRLCKEDLKLPFFTEEYTYVFALNTKNKILGVFELSHGIVNASLVRPREIFLKLLLLGAEHFCIAHNHPSQDPTASKEDLQITRRILEAGKLIGISLCDHVIVVEDCYYSFREKESKIFC